MKLVNNEQFEYVPATFVKVSDAQFNGPEARVFWARRFVFFYYEPRGEEVI